MQAFLDLHYSREGPCCDVLIFHRHQLVPSAAQDYLDTLQWPRNRAITGDIKDFMWYSFGECFCRKSVTLETSFIKIPFYLRLGGKELSWV